MQYRTARDRTPSNISTACGIGRRNERIKIVNPAAIVRKHRRCVVA